MTISGFVGEVKLDGCVSLLISLFGAACLLHSLSTLA